MAQFRLGSAVSTPVLALVILSLASAGCGYRPAPRGKLMEAATQAMERWKHRQFESMYDSAYRALRGPMSAAQWADNMRFGETESGAVVSYRIEGIQSLEPRPLGLLLFPNKRWGVTVSVVFEKVRAQVGLEFWDLDGKMDLFALDFQQESRRPHGGG